MVGNVLYCTRLTLQGLLEYSSTLSFERFKLFLGRVCKCRHFDEESAIIVWIHEHLIGSD